jgi:uncharacterized membrane protein HdeD (DUF308 family)
MAPLLLILGGVCILASLVASLWMIVEAFKTEIWKGSLCLLCGLYALYFALVELEHDYKWGLLAASLGGGILGRFLIFAAQSAAQ